MKFNMRKKLVSVAVASALSGGAMLMAAPAQAMNVSQNNLGQVLLFPYYTVKNGYDTLFTITNTSSATMVFKIRWREALNSREVRDFNVILSPYDVWTGAVTNNGSGGALVRTFDNTCTSPILPASGTVSGSREIAFTNAGYAGNLKDGGTEDISRAQEGYFEVIQMGTSFRDPSVSSNKLEYNSKHVSGVPRDCTKVDALFNDVSQLSYLLPPANDLKGHATFINVASGKAIDVEPTAIENWQTASNVIAPPGDLKPDLTDGNVNDSSNQINDGSVFTNTVIAPVANIDNLLRATSLINEYATGTNASTSWVVTFPTKHFHTDGFATSGGVPTGPTVFDHKPFVTGDPVADGGFSEWFGTKDSNGNIIDGTSCDNIGLAVYNREEGTFTPSGTQFSPVPAGSSVQLCYEVNVVDFNNSSVFGSGTNRLGLNTTSIGSAGWAELSFNSDAATTAGGLPVIGFAGITRDTGAAIANYGSSVQHAYRKPLD